MIKTIEISASQFRVHMRRSRLYFHNIVFENFEKFHTPTTVTAGRRTK